MKHDNFLILANLSCCSGAAVAIAASAHTFDADGGEDYIRRNCEMKTLVNATRCGNFPPAIDSHDISGASIAPLPPSGPA